MEHLERDAFGIVGGVVAYMLSLHRVGMGEILEKWFGFGVWKYEPEIAFAKIVIVFVLFSFSTPNPNYVQSYILWEVFLVALACAVTHKLIILRQHKNST